jgi:hypothetical protein
MSRVKTLVRARTVRVHVRVKEQEIKRHHNYV